MCAKKFLHTEASDFVLAENLGHLLVRGEILFVAWPLEIVILDVGPQQFAALRTAGLRYADDGLEIIADLKKINGKY